ncbi:ATP-binding protein [Calidifontibacillus oryziterrae]|uniref:ATP-binding protein n=1 Tax=Calidifontibacillus oryziterrae TaxID=1191699 RepID=UPI0002FDA4D0|nr:ATP-binding protein [Calidifontibacillus oryziterrae]
MYLFIKELSPNLFFITFLVLLYQFWTRNKEYSNKTKGVFVFAFSTLGVLLCMTFSIHVNNNFIFDLRYIPLIIGGLYGGPFIAVGLSLVSIAYRFYLGTGAGFYATIVVLLPVVVLMVLTYKRFQIMNTMERITFSVILSLIAAVAAVSISEIMNPINLLNTEAWLGYIIAYMVGGWVTSKIVEDTIHHELVQKQLIRNEKLEAVSHLASSISHEVRNPLTTSRGFMQLLREEDVPERYINYIDISIAEMDRAEAIIRDYLTFAKPLPEKIETFQVKVELQRALDVIQPLANMNNVIIRSHLCNGMIKGEKSRFQQCFVNLFKNAIEAMPNGGELTVHTDVEGSTMTIFIADTGIGMTEEQVSRLGEPYFSTKGMKGTGLGMMVVYRIIESMNGVIEVESKVGKGTCFMLQLPVRESNVQTNNIKKDVS